MYKIAILDKDEAYLERLIFFLKEHHRESFAINTVDSLDDIDMEVMQCDALFFGDGVEVDGALFPPDIAIGYLTEQEEADAQHINKYQSMEQIYRRMLKLCEADEPSEAECAPQKPESPGAPKEPDKPFIPEHYDLKGETVTQDGETYRVYHIEEAHADRLAIRMLSGNSIKGLFRVQYRDGSLKMCITGMKSLYEYVSENNSPRDKGKLLHFFADMAATALSLEEYMLSADKLMLNPREMYVDEEKGSVLIPYIPLKGGRSKDCRQCLEEIRGLCSLLIEGIGEEAPRVLVEKEISAQEYKTTEESDNLQKNAPDSLKLKETTQALKKGPIPYIVRKRTGEKILINRNLFKLGKDASYVDYCIRDNPAVSRNHADIVRKPDGLYLVDRGSLNHTFVNGKKLADNEYRKLADGCLMQLADEVFEFRLK